MSLSESESMHSMPGRLFKTQAAIRGGMRPSTCTAQRSNKRSDIRNQV